MNIYTHESDHLTGPLFSEVSSKPDYTMTGGYSKFTNVNSKR